MRVTMAGRTHDFGYPVFMCSRCRELYHLPQGVRHNELALLSCAAEARTKGWTVPQEGEIYCPVCSPQTTAATDSGVTE